MKMATVSALSPQGPRSSEMELLNFFNHGTDDRTTSQWQAAETQNSRAPQVPGGHQEEEEDIDLDEDAIPQT